MTYNESLKEATVKYIRNKQKRIAVNWLKDDYENRVQPAIKRTGKPVATFIKEAVNEKIEREGLG